VHTNLAVTGVSALVDFPTFASTFALAGVTGVAGDPTVADILLLLVMLLVASPLLMVCLLLMGYCCWHPSVPCVPKIVSCATAIATAASLLLQTSLLLLEMFFCISCLKAFVFTMCQIAAKNLN
jgi:hypothetical protein